VDGAADSIDVALRLAGAGNGSPGSSSLTGLQTDADFAGAIVGETNAGLLEGVLNLEDRGEVSFHRPSCRSIR